MTETTITVKGMNCNHCKMAVEQAAKSVDGVSHAEVNLDSGTLKVSVENPENTIPQVKKAVNESGYQAE